MATAPIVQSDVLAVAPELGSGSRALTPHFWSDLIAYVNQFDLASSTDGNVSEDAQSARMARIFLAAHIGKMDQLAGTAATGPLTSQSVGGVRRSYGLLSQIPGYLASLGRTSYGQLYLEVLGMSLAALPMVV